MLPSSHARWSKRTPCRTDSYCVWLLSVITGVWPREQDGTPLARSVVDWIYTVAEKFLAFEVYPADIGPDPRDAKLVAKAFGPNRDRIAPLKHKSDPHNVLTYAFQLSRQKNLPTPIILVTGESGVGKDHCAKIWTSKLKSSTQKGREFAQFALAM